MLTPEQIQFYKDNGYLLAGGVFTPKEIEECVHETDAMFDRMSSRADADLKPHGVASGGKPRFPKKNLARHRYSVSTTCNTIPQFLPR